MVPYLARTTLAAIAVLIIIVGSIRLLKQNHLSAEALGLYLSRKSFFYFLLGVFIALVVLTFMGLILYIFVPFRFVTGTLNGLGLLKESYSYFWGNFLEELIFRGFPLIILNQLLGWRKAVWIMALPFGLFHLPGLGFSSEGLKMIITTASYSFIFSYSFILTGSLWTAIGVHVASNIILHSITGLDGLKRAVFLPVFDARGPMNNLSFLTFLIAVVIISFILFLLIIRSNRSV
jgi:uncharacterized protein